MEKKFLVGFATGLFLVAMVGIANASTINVDFGFAGTNIYDGTGAAPDTGTVWNGLDFTGGTNLVDSLGVATGIGVTTGASQAYDDRGNALLGDRIFVRGSWTQFTVEISGLNDLYFYDLYIYGSNTEYSSLYSSGTESDYSLGVQDPSPWIQNQNYALLVNLSSTGSFLSFNVDRYDGSRAAVIGGFQLVETAPTPEPATIFLFGLGLLGVAGISRRRK